MRSSGSSGNMLAMIFSDRAGEKISAQLAYLREIGRLSVDQLKDSIEHFSDGSELKNVTRRETFLKMDAARKNIIVDWIKDNPTLRNHIDIVFSPDPVKDSKGCLSVNKIKVIQGMDFHEQVGECSDIPNGTGGLRIFFILVSTAR
ncbi:hypothetical protein L195_g033715 [Trifolium pratense]|uniref:Uncharacterized protein n=1 Tax=Trifolium pratense TaxID=57577 RepID=A0A2K3LGV4_TRIPR|nr:hypothetical protein L195_g033715 [Trifolium pratense]